MSSGFGRKWTYTWSSGSTFRSTYRYPLTFIFVFCDIIIVWVQITCVRSEGSFCRVLFPFITVFCNHLLYYSFLSTASPIVSSTGSIIALLVWGSPLLTVNITSRWRWNKNLSLHLLYTPDYYQCLPDVVGSTETSSKPPANRVWIHTF